MSPPGRPKGETGGRKPEGTAVSTASEADIVGVCQVSPTHPAFAGHFPGQPILPGVALLAEAMEVLLAHRPALARGEWAWEAVKFLAPVGPGAVLQVTWRPHPRGYVFDVAQADTAVARGQLAVHGMAP